MAGNGASTMLELALSFERADPNIPDNEGNTPLHFAAQAGKLSMSFYKKKRLFFSIKERRDSWKYRSRKSFKDEDVRLASTCAYYVWSKESGHVVDINFINTSRVVRRYTGCLRDSDFFDLYKYRLWSKSYIIFKRKNILILFRSRVSPVVLFHSYCILESSQFHLIYSKTKA